MRMTLFPFVGVVGQDDLKRALLLNIIDPCIGGVLVSGEMGTAKTTVVRSLADILPDIDPVDECVSDCDTDGLGTRCGDCKDGGMTGEPQSSVRRMRVIELPLCLTEGIVSGTFGVEHVSKAGEGRFESDVMAQAEGNLLFVDGIDLLDERITCTLLDSVATGIHPVEGTPLSHQTRFALVGVMGSENVALGPRILDRIGMSVDVKGDRGPTVRKEVIRRHIEFDADPLGYLESVREENRVIRESLLFSRRHLKEVRVDESIYDTVVNILSHFDIVGHRADITMVRAARANAALHGRAMVVKDDVRKVAHLVLAHRMRSCKSREPGLDEDRLAAYLKEI